ncbi:uncharacterized protein Pyn_04431 [Prunus yedoensis var. nudiflora]|uniref:Uncharacterized protein n=1 Tax=Prunus yedoensis var. nudiflora TaxID=2094558 RepID=A0A314YTD2_PRUYE|nr:uncharacterized protein Pyn_04431 [Prunus yedoensis var. nudiflora]
MKRQRRVDVGGATMDQGSRFEGTTATTTTTMTMAMASKKAKKTIDKAAGKEDVRIDGGDHQLGLVAAENLMAGEENYWGCLSGAVVDEQMSWGSIWMPFWDVEFMGEAHYGLFSDVIWDDDIWGLRTTREESNP